MVDKHTRLRLLLAALPLTACANVVDSGDYESFDGDLRQTRQAAATSDIIGRFDIAQNSFIQRGWLCDRNRPSTSLQVHMYFGGKADADPADRIGVSGIWASLASEGSVNSACGGPNHRFSFTPTTRETTFLGPGVHPTYAYMIDPYGPNYEILGSARSIAVPASESVPRLNSRRELLAQMRGSSNYAYGPSMLYYHGNYHAFACTGSNSEGDWVRYINTENGPDTQSGSWAPPTDSNEPGEHIALSYVPYAGTQAESRHACDPEVVRFTPPGSSTPYFYMFFSVFRKPKRPVDENVNFVWGTVNAVARSTSLAGPYSILTGNGWEAPCDADRSDCSQLSKPPKPIQFATPAEMMAGTEGSETDPPCTLDRLPLRENGDAAEACYGVGQPAVVNRNGTLHMWYTNTRFRTLKGVRKHQIYHTTSNDGITWSTAKNTEVVAASVTVVFDPAVERYFMFYFWGGEDPYSPLYYHSSADGDTWTPRAEVNSAVRIEDNASNPGIVRDEYGFTTGNKSLLGYGIPRAQCPPDAASCSGWQDLMTTRVLFKWQ